MFLESFITTMLFLAYLLVCSMLFHRSNQKCASIVAIKSRNKELRGMNNEEAIIEQRPWKCLLPLAVCG